MPLGGAARRCRWLYPARTVRMVFVGSSTVVEQPPHAAFVFPEFIVNWLDIMGRRHAG